MRTSVSIALLLLLVALGGPLASAGASAPSHDDRADAEPITELPFSASFTPEGATVEPGEADGCQERTFGDAGGRTVWYALTPDQDLVLEVSFDEEAPIDQVAFFQAGQDHALDCPIHGEDGTLLSRIPVAEGERIDIQVVLDGSGPNLTEPVTLTFDALPWEPPQDDANTGWDARLPWDSYLETPALAPFATYTGATREAHVDWLDVYELDTQGIVLEKAQAVLVHLTFDPPLQGIALLEHDGADQDLRIEVMDELTLGGVAPQGPMEGWSLILGTGTEDEIVLADTDYTVRWELKDAVDLALTQLEIEALGPRATLDPAVTTEAQRFTLTVENQGDGTAQAGMVNLLVRDNCMYEPYLVTGLSHPGLAPGEAWTGTIDWEPPAYIVGQYEVRASVEAPGDDDPSNNQRTAEGVVLADVLASQCTSGLVHWSHKAAGNEVAYWPDWTQRTSSAVVAAMLDPLEDPQAEPGWVQETVFELLGAPVRAMEDPTLEALGHIFDTGRDATYAVQRFLIGP